MSHDNALDAFSNLNLNSLPITKPFIKWVGGKTQIISDVIRSITISEKIYASDLNSNLIALYKNIQTSPYDLIKEVKKLR